MYLIFKHTLSEKFLIIKKDYSEYAILHKRVIHTHTTFDKFSQTFELGFTRHKTKICDYKGRKAYYTSGKFLEQFYQIASSIEEFHQFLALENL